MTWAANPGIHVLATIEIPPTRSAGDHKGEVVPQIWTYEHTLARRQPARAFVWMRGHTDANFANYQIQRTLLRGIEWAGKKPADELVNYVPPARRPWNAFSQQGTIGLPARTQPHIHEDLALRPDRSGRNRGALTEFLHHAEGSATQA
jgi:hypothetical protein